MLADTRIKTITNTFVDKVSSNKIPVTPGLFLTLTLISTLEESYLGVGNCEGMGNAVHKDYFSKGVCVKIFRIIPNLMWDQYGIG